MSTKAKPNGIPMTNVAGKRPTTRNVVVWSVLSSALLGGLVFLAVGITLLSLVTYSAIAILMLALVFTGAFAGLGYATAAAQEAYAEGAFGLTLPAWRRIGLVTGAISGVLFNTVLLLWGGRYVNLGLNLNIDDYAVTAFTVLGVMVVVQAAFMARALARAWLWLLPSALVVPLVLLREPAWRDLDAMSHPWIESALLLVLFHLLGGLVLAHLARHSTRKHIIAGPPPLEA